MRRLYLTILTALVTFTLCSSTTLAFTGDGSGDPGPVETPSDPSPGGDGGGGGGSGGGGGEPAPEPEPKVPEILSYTPVVTALHSVNAGFAREDGLAVYFLPQLEDFPVDLVDTCADVTSEDGQEHKFAVVYDGYFDTEVAYSLAQNDNTDTSDVHRLQTSKKVYSQTDNSRCLNLLGYDLLLSDERVKIVTVGDKISFDYYPTLVGTAPITTKTAVMDLYKAVGQYEWDIKIAFGKDDTLKVSTSPIMQQIAVLTNDEVEGGIDTEEGATWVWATRTNPDIYWTRASRDALFDGGAHLYTSDVYVGNNVSVSFSKNETQTLTMLEFLQLARAIMELYGEPILTELEIERALQAYALQLPTGSMSDEAMETVRYMAAKGIIEPGTIDLNKTVTFADIEEILLRIADEQSRLTFKMPNLSSSTMSRAGYSKVSLSGVDTEFQSCEEIVNPFDSDYYDYYIEAVDGYTNFYLNKLSGVDLTQQDNMTQEPTDPSQDTTPPTNPNPGTKPKDGTSPPSSRQARIPTDPIIQEEKVYAFACDKLIVEGAEIGPTTTGSGYFQYCGMKEVLGRYYYHFQIARTIGSVTISYDADPALEQLLDITSYTLPDADGGVYNYSEGLPAKQTFDEAGFSDMFVDADRYGADYNGLEVTESYLSDYHWYKITYTTAEWDNLVKGSVGSVFKYKYGAGDYQTEEVIAAKDLEQARNTTDRRFLDKGGNAWYVYESSQDGSADLVIVICQTKMSRPEFNQGLCAASASNNPKAFIQSTAYYKADDGTLLASYEYLRAKGLCSNIQVPKQGTGIMFSTAKGNVSLRNDLDLIIVGDTAIPADGELLYYKEGTNFYINLKACLGWSKDWVAVTTDDTLIPIIDLSSALRGVSVSASTKSMTTYFPRKSLSLGTLSLNMLLSPDKGGSGLALTSSNPLGCYMVVMDQSGSADYLFVWHRRDVVLPSGGEGTSGDSDAISTFNRLTGVNVSSVSSNYVLSMYPLSRENTGNPAGIKYLSYTSVQSYGAVERALGYVYTPPKFGSVNDALNAYASGDSKCAIPVAEVNGKYVNLNLNTCTDMEGNEQLPIGTLPMSMDTEKKDAVNKMGRINSGGTGVEETSASYDNLESTQIYTAPVGLFQALKGLGARPLSEWSSKGALFFGSSQCEVKNGSITIKGRQLEFDDNVDAVCALLSSSASAVFVINEDSSSLGQLLGDKLEDFAVVVTDPETLIDWSQYKFKRLVENIDSWSSILLIFVLNVLPRIGMLLFFVLMLLSLIKNVKFWRTFCVEHFDVYSFLTMGKQNVDTVNTGKIMGISLICFSIFLIIMDGQLFNFVIFICRFIVILTQR